MATIRLVAIDLDGTLLDDRKSISARNLRVLESLLQKGVAIALASARDCGSISQVVPIEHPGMYYIASGGALIYDRHACQIVWEKHLSRRQVTEGVAFLQQFGHPVFLNNFNDYWVDLYNERVQYIEERYLVKTQSFSEIEKLEGQIMRMSLAAPEKILRQAAGLAEDTFRNELTVSLASADWLDLLLPEAGKGALLKILQARLGILIDQTMAIGDYESDLSLFEHSGIKVAMGNAVDSLKEAATYLAATNNEDGVAEGIQRFISFNFWEAGEL
jgi:Cof subfamily protein (haloacid dehalogenase superfamily)